MQVFNEGANELGLAAKRVEVFVAENQCPASFARPLERDPKSPCVTEMQKTRRRGREASAISRMRIRNYGSQILLGCHRGKVSLNLGSGKVNFACALAQFSEVSGGRGSPS